MSQGYKFKYDEMKQGNPADKETVKAENESFAENTHVRNLCFIWPNSRKKFLNYAYLVSGDYDPEKSNIILMFTSDTVNIKGVRLDTLFNELINHLPRQIICTEERYNALVTDESYIVNEIEIIRNE